MTTKKHPVRLFLTVLVLFGLLNCSSRESEPPQATIKNASPNLNANAANTNANAHLYALDEKVPPITKDVEVPADVMWFDTGVTLEDGKKFMIQAKGKWSFGKTFVGPFGEIGLSVRGALLPEADIGTLVGKVEDDVFYIGERIAMPSSAGGKLFLSINDMPNSFRDNKGRMRVSITYPQPSDR